MSRIVLRVAILGLGVLIVVSAANAMAAANRVPVTAVEDAAMPITANDLKPQECAGLNLEDVVIWHDDLVRDKAPSLILGTPNRDIIKGGGGDDCILGGGGNDDINGNKGDDVCIGGPGTDTFKNCAATVP